MRIIQLLLPTTDHRIHALRQFKWHYDITAHFVGENGMTSLGVIGSIGFLALLATLALRRRSRPAPGDDAVGAFAVLNLSAVLLGTMGGFGSLIAYLGLPQIRTYSRLVVFIAFFSLLPVLRLLDRLTRARPRLGHVAVVVIVVIGLLDQATPAAVRAYGKERRAFLSDRRFIQQVEKLIAPGEIVFDLPHVDFPEGVRRVRLDSYDLLRPYLHSSTLHFSLPTMRGRNDDAFVRATSELPPERMLETLAQVGYGGILINRDGYDDFGAALEAGLQPLLGAAPISSEDGRFSFFSLAEYRRRGPPKLPPPAIIQLLYPLAVTFDQGFFEVEHDGVWDFRWCQGRCEIAVDNDTAWTRRVQLRATLMAARPPTTVTMTGDLLSGRFDLGTPFSISRTIEIPPGRHVLRFDSNGRPAIAPGDPRTLIWRIAAFALIDSADPGSAKR
jgi:phosphoglycerol transferase